MNTDKGKSGGRRKRATGAGPAIREAKKLDRAEWGRLRRALWPDCKGPRAELEMRGPLNEPGEFGVLGIDRGGGKLGGFAELARRAAGFRESFRVGQF